MKPAEKHIKRAWPASLNWGGLAGGIMIAVAVALGLAQFAQAYQLARRPWLISSPHGIWDGFGLLFIVLSPVVLFIGLTLTLIVLTWAILRRRMGDAVCSTTAMVIWFCPFWFALPGYGGEAGAFRLVQDTRFNTAVATEMAALNQQRRTFGSGNILATPIGKGSWAREFPILAELHPSDIWFGKHALFLMYGARQMYSLRILPGLMKSGVAPWESSAVLYFRIGEDDALIPVAVLAAAKRAACIRPK